MKINNFDELEIYPHNSLEKLDIGNLLDFQEDRIAAIRRAFVKMRYNGELALSGLDMVELAYDIVSFATEISEYNKLIYGRKSLSQVTEMENILKNNGYRIIHKSYQDNQYHLIGKRINGNS